MATLNKKGFSATIYRWFYGLELYELPQNLCPYFWKSVLMYLTIIPYSIFCLPVIVWEIFDKGYTISDRKCGERIGYAVGMYIAGLILTALCASLGWFFFQYAKDGFLYTMATVGILCWAFAIGIGIWTLLGYLKDKAFKSERKWDEEKREYVKYTPAPAAAIEMIVATYHKYCPELKWK